MSTGVLLGQLGTPASPSGLGRINGWSTNSQVDNTTLAVYGGDLEGNLWRLDTDYDSGANANYLTVSLVAVAKDALGNRQPITVKPELGESLTAPKQRIVLCATGKFLETTDKTGPFTTQTIYALRDVPTVNPGPVIADVRGASVVERQLPGRHAAGHAHHRARDRAGVDHGLRLAPGPARQRRARQRRPATAAGYVRGGEQRAVAGLLHGGRHLVPQLPGLPDRLVRAGRDGEHGEPGDRQLAHGGHQRNHAAGRQGHHHRDHGCLPAAVAGHADQPGRVPVSYFCGGSPANEVIATFFQTEPPTLIAEHGDRVSLMYLQKSASGAKYQGRNETLWEHQGEAMITWGYGSKEMKCKKR